MSLDRETVRRVARLARIRVDEDRLDELGHDLNRILGFVEHLDEVDISGVQPMTSVAQQGLRWREDRVSDGGYADRVTGNAPAADHDFFAVPRVVE